jgi:hypothetical protein
VICLHHLTRASQRTTYKLLLEFCFHQYSVVTLLLGLALHQESMGFLHSAREVIVIGQKVLEIYDRLIEESTSDDWSKFFSESLKNGRVDSVTYEGSPGFILEFVEFADVDLVGLQVETLILLLWLLWHLLVLHLRLFRKNLIVLLLTLSLTWLILVSHVFLLVACWFVIAILLLLILESLLLMRILMLVCFSLVTALATSCLASSAATSVISSPSLIVPISLIIVSHHLIWRTT